MDEHKESDYDYYSSDCDKQSRGEQVSVEIEPNDEEIKENRQEKIESRSDSFDSFEKSRENSQELIEHGSDKEIQHDKMKDEEKAGNELPSIDMSDVITSIFEARRKKNENQNDEDRVNAPPKEESYSKSPPKRQNEQENGGQMPPALKSILFHPPTSLTYRVLDGEIPTNMTTTMYTSIVNDLRKYIDSAVDHGLISEACYIQNVIDDLKLDKGAEKISNDRELNSIDQKIKEANEEIDERVNYWNAQQTMIDKELEMSLQELEVQRSLAIQKLDEEWQSQKKMQLYSKPSPALLNLRDQVKKMIKAKKFEDVKALSKIITDKEQAEAAAATKRMNADYRAADQHIQEKFDHEKTVLYANHETKTNNIKRSKERNLRPLNQRLENLTKQKELILKNQKKVAIQEASRKSTKSRITGRDMSKSPHSAQSSQRQQQQAQVLPSIIKNPKLNIAGITPIKREGRTTSSATIFRPRSISASRSPRVSNDHRASSKAANE